MVCSAATQGSFSRLQDCSSSSASSAVDDGVEHDAGRRLHVLEHPLELAAVTHQRVDMLDGAHLRILHPHRLGDHDERLAGRVGDHMEVERAGDIHGYPLDNRE